MTSRLAFSDELARWHEGGHQARFWLRDDDAVAPTAALDRLLALPVPVTIAAIPAGAETELAVRVAGEKQADIAVHGYAHKNHAQAGEKKQEIGLHRGRATIVEELSQGLARSRQLFGEQLVPLLVPPWNRIDPAVVGELPAIGFAGLSTFGGKAFKSGPLLAVIDTHVDLIDWRGTRRGRPMAIVMQELTGLLSARRQAGSDEPVGILAHHLVHDEAAWVILNELVAMTDRRPGAAWISSRALLAAHDRPS